MVIADRFLDNFFDMNTNRSSYFCKTLPVDGSFVYDDKNGVSA